MPLISQQRCHTFYAVADNHIQDWTIPDPSLTDLGIQQCRELSEHLQRNLPIADEAELIVVSPLRRTLHTAQLGLDWLIERGVPVQPRGEWQENSNMPCDTGTHVETLVREFPQFSYDTVFPEFPNKTGRWAFSEEAILQRGSDCRRWLKSRPEKVIAVVTHSAFLRIGIAPTRFANADYRVFDFVADGDELHQWPLTDENGGGMGKSPKGAHATLPSDFEIPDYMKELQQPKAVGEAATQVPK